MADAGVRTPPSGKPAFLSSLSCDNTSHHGLGLAHCYIPIERLTLLMQTAGNIATDGPLQRNRSILTVLVCFTEVDDNNASIIFRLLAACLQTR